MNPVMRALAWCGLLSAWVILPAWAEESSVSNASFRIVAISFSQKDSNTWCNNEYEVKTLLSGINKNIEELL